jgi:uncharacterized protein YjbI with pentapeptide repeats
MKARKLLQEYAAGQRNFSGAKLQGQSFRDRDLSDADFSGANIRGTDFTDAILKGVIFDRADAGLQKRWLAVKLVPVFFASALAGVLQGYFGWWIARYVNSEVIQNSSFLAIIVIFTYTTIIIAIGSQGLDLKALVKIAVVDIIAVAIIVGIILPFNKNFAFNLAGAVAVGGAGAFAVSFADAVTISFTLATTNNIIFICAIVLAFISAVIVVIFTKFDGAIIIPIVSFIFSIYVRHRISRKDKKFTLIYTIRNMFGVIGGTNFSGADLTGATFAGARLENTSFLSSCKNSTTLDLVCWKDAQMLESAELGDCILSNPDVRKLLVDVKTGYKQNFVNANFRGANLKDADLRGSNFTGVDMSGATLEGALLNNAILKSTQAIGTNFSNAVFTGACLETWNIDKNTKFDQVDCEYIFQLECRNDLGSNERRPHDPNECFKKGDFEKLYRKLSNTIEVLLRDGFQNAEAFNVALQALMQEQPEITFESIRKIDDDVLVTFEVDQFIDKTIVSRNFLELYDENRKLYGENQKLSAKVDELQECRVSDIKEVIGIIKPSKSKFSIKQKQSTKNKAMTDKRLQPDYSGSNVFYNTGSISDSIINIGSIIDRIENEINQIPDTASPKLIEYLTELKEEIQSSSELPIDDKADVLEGVEALAKVAQTPDSPEKVTLVRKAIKVLKGTVVALPGAVKFAESCAKLLPLISDALDISI